MKRKTLFLLIVFQAFVIFANDETSILKLDLPLFDLPYQIYAMDTVGHGFFSSYANPSMAQSLSIATNLFSGFHYGMRMFYDTSTMNKILKNIIYYGGTAIGDFALFMIPFGGDAWMHEEYHRAVMSLYGVNSFNSVYVFGNYVNNLTDEDLTRFKMESPVNFIRLQEAGIEAEYLLIDTLQKNNFFYNKNHFSEFVYWALLVNEHIYITNPGWKGAGENIPDRDFTGADPIGWVYDLFRPNEPYTERGIHPSGIGIDRYRTLDDLTDRERDYIKKVGYWQFVNYISPMMFFFKSLPLGNTDIQWNFSFRHFLTSFGTDLVAKLYFTINEFNFITAYHNYQNFEHIFPAIEIEMVDYPVRIGNFGMYISPKLMIGMQPKRQDFFTSEVDFFGLIGSRIDFQIHKYWLPYFELTAKTNGWVAENEFLEKKISFKLGISARF